MLLLFSVVLGYNYVRRPFAGPEMEGEGQQQNLASESADLSTNQPLPRWQLANLSPEQKIGQLLVVPYNLSASTASDEAMLRQYLSLEPSGLILFGSKIDAIETKQLTSLVSRSTALDSIPVMITVDHEGGDVQRLAGNGFSVLPSARELCTQTEETRVAILEQSAQELALAGIHLVFGPTIDVASNSSVLKNRVCSGDPLLVSQYGEQFVAAFSNRGILPVLKHYPGIGSVTKDLHKSFDQQIVLANDVTPFKTILTTFPQIGVMVAHMGIVNQIAGLPCSVSTDCIDQLKNTNPQALVISDALTMKAVAYDGETNDYTRTLESVALSAVYAGNQLLVFGPEATPEELQLVRSALTAQYMTDSTFAKKVDVAVERVLDAKEFQIFK